MTRQGEHDVIESHGGQDKLSVQASFVSSPLMEGRRFQSWFSGSRVAYWNYETARRRYAMRVVDLATDQAVATMTWSRRTGSWLKIHGWWDRRRVLISMDRSLATWAPDTGEVVRVATLPVSDIRYEHAAVGLSFPENFPEAVHSPHGR